ncbi:MAG: FHA domain-containing protein [Acidobacteriota bacterium]
MGLLEKFRQWLDADYQESSEKESRPRNKSEEFLVSVAREIENVMKEQMFTPPGGPTYIPRNYIVFLSIDDDAEWRGEKRRGLEQGLFYVLSEQASALVGTEQRLQTSSFAVELRTDGTLEKGKFRVQAVWDNETDKTAVRPRSKKSPLTDEETIVRTRNLFHIKVSRSGENEAQTFNFNQPAITIGRGSRDQQVDLPLAGDMEISRHQATIEYQQGHFKLTCAGRNSITIAGKELLPGESVTINSGQRIEISSYILQPGESNRK